jgi:2-dehydropantoate 2-reductase
MGVERLVAVFGAGSVGLYLGALLAKERTTRVTLIGRTPVCQAVERHGVRIDDHGSHMAVEVAMTDDVASLPPNDLVILTMRGYDVDAALPDIERLAGASGLVMGMQNGVGTDARLMRLLPLTRLMAGTLTSSVSMVEPGLVERQSRSGGMALATLSGVAPPDWIVGMFRETGLPVGIVTDFRALRWSKLLLNMLGAGTSAALDADLTTIVSHQRLFRIEQLAVREAGRVMDHLSIATVDLPGYPSRLLRLAMRLPRRLAQVAVGRALIASRGGRSPSMRADLRRGRTESSFLYGAVACAGHQVGVVTPICTALDLLLTRLAGDEESRAALRANPTAVLDALRDLGARV